MKIAIVAVTFNSAADLEVSLPGLSDGFDGFDWHLYVADNLSTDATADTVRRLVPSATVIDMGRNAGYAAGINAGVAAAARDGYDVLVIMNVDIKVPPAVMGPLVAALEEPGVGIAVPRLTLGDGSLITSLRREATVPRLIGDAVLGASRAGRWPAWGETVVDPSVYERPARSDWAAGPFLACSRQCLERTGRWDERFFLYSEETDFCLRARDLGFAVSYVPDVTVSHFEGESRSAPALYALLTLNRVRLYRKRHGLLASAVYWLAAIVRETIRIPADRALHGAALAALVRDEAPAPAPAAADAGWLRLAPPLETADPGAAAVTGGPFAARRGP